MKSWVVDASVAVKWFLPGAANETNLDRALELLELAEASQALFLQPPHWIAEVAAVLARRIPDSAVENISDLKLFDFINIIGELSIYRLAIDLSANLDHHLFDTLYHAIALEYGVLFITADQRYYAKAAKLGGIALLGDFEP